MSARCSARGDVARSGERRCAVPITRRRCPRAANRPITTASTRMSTIFSGRTSRNSPVDAWNVDRPSLAQQFVDVAVVTRSCDGDVRIATVARSGATSMSMHPSRPMISMSSRRPRLPFLARQQQPDLAVGLVAAHADLLAVLDVTQRPRHAERRTRCRATRRSGTAAASRPAKRKCSTAARISLPMPWP